MSAGSALAARRLLARAIDLGPALALAAACFGAGVLLPAQVLVRASLVVLVVGTLAAGAWSVAALAGAGRTPGKRLAGLRVAGRGGAPPTLARAALREALLFLALVPLVGVVLLAIELALLFVGDGRTLRDRLAGTHVEEDGRSTGRAASGTSRA